MGNELRRQTQWPEMEVRNLNSLLLSICDLTRNSDDADQLWYETTLPTPQPKSWIVMSAL